MGDELDKLVLMDGNNLAHIVFHSAQNLARRQKIEESQRLDFLEKMTYHMFFNKFFSLVKKFKDNRIFITWDSKNSTAWRRTQDSNYKSNRVASDDVKQSLFKAIDNLREIIPSLPVYQYYQDGFEADDIIYYVASKMENVEMIIVSNDQDLQQIAQRFNATIWDPKKNVDVEVPSDYDITVKKALVGDSSDNIPGVKGIGEKGGTKIARELYGKNITRDSVLPFVKNESDADVFALYLSMVDISLNPNLEKIDINLNMLFNEKSMNEENILNFYKKYSMKSQIGSWSKNKKALMG